MQDLYDFDKEIYSNVVDLLECEFVFYNLPDDVDAAFERCLNELSQDW